MPLPSLGGLTNAYKALPGSARRTLLHTGMGMAGGAALGGLTAQEGQRARGALTGGIIGGAAAGGASYLANRSAGTAIKGLRSDNVGLKTTNQSLTTQNNELSNRVSQMDSQLAGLGSQNASLMAANVDLEGRFNALNTNYQQAQNDIAAAKLIIGNPAAGTSAQAWGTQHGAPGSGAVASRPAPVAVPPRAAPPRAPTQPVPASPNAATIQMPAGHTPTIQMPAGHTPTMQMPAGHTPTIQMNTSPTMQTPAYPTTRETPISGIFPKAAFALTPGQGAALGVLGGAVIGGGVTALDPETRNLPTIVRNAGLGGLIGTAGGYGLTLGGANGGYADGYGKGHAAGSEDTIRETVLEEIRRQMGL